MSVLGRFAWRPRRSSSMRPEASAMLSWPIPMQGAGRSIRIGQLTRVKARRPRAAKISQL